MANYDEFAAAVKEVSGGENVVLFDDLGLPSVYVPINRLKNSEIIEGGSDVVHPAFSVNGVEKTRFLFSKYQNVIINDRAYSLARRIPSTNITFDNARKACEAKGSGYYLATFAEWAAIALLTRKMSTMPHGNDCYGYDYSHDYENGERYESGTKNGKTLTGSGPATWGHDHSKFGIQDMNGNVREWLAGMRLKDGEIQIIPNNDAALASCDMSATSTLWKAIKSDGSLVESSSGDTLRYVYLQNKMQLSTDSTTEFSAFNKEYSSITLADGLTAPEAIKALALYPDEPGGDYSNSRFALNTQSERLSVTGDYWGTGNAGSGIFSMDFYYDRSTVNANIGFRSAFFEP
jgi:formylglycine-generating enzyme